MRASHVPKIALNRSWFDATSAEFLRARTIKVRGSIDNGAIALRTLWPEDFRMDRHPALQPLRADEPSTLALRALMRAEPSGGARSPFAVSTLWRRNAERDALPPGCAVLGIMVNGAQGDDDEAHGGHFALVTGRTRNDGAIDEWLVNNF